MTKIAVITGSVRKNRFNDKPAQWILGHLQKRPGLETELLDLLDFPMPFFDESPPSVKSAPYPNEVVERWTGKIAAADGFVIVTPEYNHGTSGVLKNAIDWVYKEWNKKPVGFVSYGSASGTRAVEHLRLVSVELQMAPIRPAIHLPWEVVGAHFKGEDVGAKLASYDDRAGSFVDDLLWWTNALKAARGASTA